MSWANGPTDRGAWGSRADDNIAACDKACENGLLAAFMSYNAKRSCWSVLGNRREDEDLVKEDQSDKQ